jgi:hypothetical protein
LAIDLSMRDYHRGGERRRDRASGTRRDTNGRVAPLNETSSLREITLPLDAQGI